jgi:competence protein ComEA
MANRPYSAAEGDSPILGPPLRSRARKSGQSPYSHQWLLHRNDQVAVAALAITALAAMFGWWVACGGWQGNLIEIERAEPLSARFTIDINAADSPELAQLPRIGPTLSRRIVESRRADGPFANHDDLRRVRGIGPKTLEQIRPYLRPMPQGSAKQ